MASALFKNVVRVLAAADEKSVVQFCEEGGTVERISTLSKSGDKTDCVFIVWFKSESSAYEAKRRCKTTKLGGRAVRVDILAESPSLQEQYGVLCRMSGLPARSPLLLPRSLKSGSEKENHALVLSPSRPPMSAPSALLLSKVFRKENDLNPTAILHYSLVGVNTSSTRLISPDASRVSHRTPKTEPPPLRSLKRLDLRQSTSSSKYLSFRLSSTSNSTTSTIERLPSRLIRSTSLPKDSARISDVFNSTRSSMTSPPISRARSGSSPRTQSFLADRTVTSARMTETTSATRRTAEVHPMITSPSPLLLPTKTDLLKQELVDAKERYAQSLSKVKDHLTLLETKYKDHLTLLETKYKDPQAPEVSLERGQIG